MIAQCRWYNNVTNSLDTEGCTYVHTSQISNRYSCQCTHLTTFVVVDTALLTPVPQQPSGAPVSVIVISCVAAAALVGLIIAGIYMRNRRRAKRATAGMIPLTDMADSGNHGTEVLLDKA